MIVVIDNDEKKKIISFTFTLFYHSVYTNQLLFNRTKINFDDTNNDITY